MFFKSEEDRKEFHQSLLTDHERIIKHIEYIIKYNNDMVTVYKGLKSPEIKNRWEFFAAQVKEWEGYLKDAKAKLKKEEEKFDARYLTIQEKALNKGLTVINGGLCENA